MKFASVRLVTADIKRLVGFYETVTGLKASWFTEDFAELRSEGATLALGSAATVKALGDKAPRPGENRSAILEYRVDDVDAVHARIAAALDDVVLPPTTMPWGNRSLLFRDPDGNLVNFFTPVSREAAARAEG